MRVARRRGAAATYVFLPSPHLPPHSIHILCAGHPAEVMAKAGEYLGRLANHGAEAENKNIVLFFFRHSQRGGWCGNRKATKIGVIVRYSKRKILRRAGKDRAVYAALLERRHKARCARMLASVRKMVAGKKQMRARAEMAANDERTPTDAFWRRFRNGAIY